MLATPRLRLVPATPQMIRWEMGNHSALSTSLGAVVPATWPLENVRDALAFLAQAAEANVSAPQWCVYYWLADDVTPGEHTLVGSGGFFGPPTPNGAVEIGYGTLEVFQGRGYATEAVQALTRWASAQPGVMTVSAQADAGNIASLNVLRKCHFEDAGLGQEARTRRFVYAGESV